MTRHWFGRPQTSALWRIVYILLIISELILTEPAKTKKSDTAPFSKEKLATRGTQVKCEEHDAIESHVSFYRNSKWDVRPCQKNYFSYFCKVFRSFIPGHWIEFKTWFKTSAFDCDHALDLIGSTLEFIACIRKIDWCCFRNITIFVERVC